MYKIKKPLFLICETPLHAGSGSELGDVDLPIQRERHTNFPKIESSSFKGAMREAFETGIDDPNAFGWDTDNIKVQRIFGFDEGSPGQRRDDFKKAFTLEKDVGGKKDKIDISDFAGCISFSDARLLLFPVKSMKGVFVWITCPQVLNKLRSDLDIVGYKGFEHLEKIKDLEVIPGEGMVTGNSICIDESIVLEEFSFEVKESPELKAFATELADNIFNTPALSYWKSLLKSNLVLLSNDDFRDFVSHATEVITRIKIDNDTGTVADGALFTEEYLPCDAVMYSLIMVCDEHSKKPGKMGAEEVMEFFTKNKPPIFQLGANANLGKGMLRTQLLNQKITK